MEQNVSKILQWNTQGITTAKQDILKLIQLFEPIVLSFQETFLANDYQIKLKRYNAIVKQGTFNRRYHGGVALYVHEECPMEEVEVQSQYQVVAARVGLGNNTLVTIANFYIPGSIDIEDGTLEAIIASLPKPCIILGDFNAHNHLWGDKKTTSRGRKCEQTFQECRLSILNTGAPTHSSGSAIDLSLASARAAANCSWEVYPSVLSSDHYPIIVTYEAPATGAIVQQNNYNFKKAQWEAYTEDEKWKSMENQPKGTCEEMIVTMYNKLHNVAAEHIPAFQRRRFYPKTWWSAECSRVWKERERLYKKWKRSACVDDKIRWKRARAIATRTFRVAKQEDMKQYLSKMTVNTPAAKIYEKIRQIRGRPPRRINILRSQDKIMSTVPAIVNCLAENFASVSDPSGDAPAFQRVRQREEQQSINFRCDNTEPYNDVFTMEELTSALNTAKDTTPGPDNVHYKMLKYLPQSAMTYLLGMFNRFWSSSYFPSQWKNATIIPIAKPNKDHSDPNYYRPIALTSCIGKIFE